MLDSNVSGCVNTWLSNGGRIDDWRWDVLADCEQKLNRAIPANNVKVGEVHVSLIVMGFAATSR